MENLNLFIRSVFIDNMIFAYFLGMCSYLAVSKKRKNGFWSRHSCDIHACNNSPYRLYA